METTLLPGTGGLEYIKQLKILTNGHFIKCHECTNEFPIEIFYRHWNCL